MIDNNWAIEKRKKDRILDIIKSSSSTEKLELLKLEVWVKINDFTRGIRNSFNNSQELKDKTIVESRERQNNTNHYEFNNMIDDIIKENQNEKWWLTSKQTMLGNAFLNIDKLITPKNPDNYKIKIIISILSLVNKEETVDIINNRINNVKKIDIIELEALYRENIKLFQKSIWIKPATWNVWPKTIEVLLDKKALDENTNTDNSERKTVNFDLINNKNWKKRTYGDLYAYHFWSQLKKNKKWKLYVDPIQLKTRMTLNPSENLRNLYKKKFSRSNGSFKEEIPLMKKYYNKNIKNIDFKEKSKRIGIDEYKLVIKSQINKIKDQIDWSKFSSSLWTKKLNLYKKMINSIDENVLLSYNMTEFFPTGSPSGIMEKSMLDFILKNYGVEYVYNNPAIYDNCISFWPYQFTSLAYSKKKKSPVNKMNNYLKKPILNWEMSWLKWESHHCAAMLLAMYNMMRLVQKLSPQEVEFYNKKSNGYDFKLLIAQMIAVWHNYPWNLLKSAKLYFNSQSKWRKKTFYECMTEKNLHAANYANKTYYNYNAAKSKINVNMPIVQSL